MPQSEFALHILYRFVNYLIESNINALTVGKRFRFGIGPHIKSDHYSMRDFRQHQIGFVYCTYCAVYNIYSHLIGTQL